uniref:Uncharacterized protein n=1 Tax=Entomoneis paludosa TaxID=265537 RepID=A0A7S2YJD8_9STRA|mmetsp:Transcript_35039/g.72962  ORF Transcript_35039/g.72962 Transcript_35039/m.72962 type:complete len:112 (+) Transcript_35039:304-639(+)
MLLRGTQMLGIKGGIGVGILQEESSLEFSLVQAQPVLFGGCIITGPGKVRREWSEKETKVRVIILFEQKFSLMDAAVISLRDNTIPSCLDGFSQNLPDSSRIESILCGWKL